MLSCNQARRSLRTRIHNFWESNPRPRVWKHKPGPLGRVVLTLLYNFFSKYFQSTKCIRELTCFVRGLGFAGNFTRMYGGELQIPLSPTMKLAISTTENTLYIRLSGRDVLDLIPSSDWTVPSQPHCQKSKIMLSKLIFNKTVHIKVLNIDQYLRTQNLNLNVGLIKINADYKGFQNEFYAVEKCTKESCSVVSLFNTRNCICRPEP